jgi:hypothetical protein
MYKTINLALEKLIQNCCQQLPYWSQTGQDILHQTSEFTKAEII